MRHRGLMHLIPPRLLSGCYLLAKLFRTSCSFLVFRNRQQQTCIARWNKYADVLEGLLGADSCDALGIFLLVILYDEYDGQYTPW